MTDRNKSYLSALRQQEPDDVCIEKTFEYYTKQYQSAGWIRSFVANSPLIPESLSQAKEIGLCDRTLGKHIPAKRTYEGGAIRGSLKRTKLATPAGGELFRSCVVFPTRDSNGNIVSAVGYRFAKRLRTYDRSVIYWEKPSCSRFVEQSIALAKEILND